VTTTQIKIFWHFVVLLKFHLNVHQTDANFTNILSAAFAPKSFRQKTTNQNCKHIKAAKKNICIKMILVKYWWIWQRLEVSLLNKISSLTTALGVTKFLIIKAANFMSHRWTFNSDTSSTTSVTKFVAMIITAFWSNFYLLLQSALDV